jgi:pimeloyl-ACP methyl ester carboxylesterase
VVPLGLRLAAGSTAARFLAEFLTEGERPWLSAVTPAPGRAPVDGRGDLTADLWTPAGPGPHPGLLLVHGLAADGKDDPRMLQAAALLARLGRRVLVPDLPALRAQRLRPDDAGPITAGLAQLAGDPAVDGARLALVSVSVGAGPAFLALAGPGPGRGVALIVTLGGYADARELIRHATTARGLDPELVRAFVRVNLDLVRDPTDREAVRRALEGQPLAAGAGPEARAVHELLGNRDPGRVDALITALPAETRALLDALSPARHSGRVGGRLVAVHGRDDPTVPFTESLRLAAAGPRGHARAVLVGVVGHVEGAPSTAGQLGDLLRLLGVVYELVRR